MARNPRSPHLRQIRIAILRRIENHAKVIRAAQRAPLLRSSPSCFSAACILVFNIWKSLRQQMRRLLHDWSGESDSDQLRNMFRMCRRVRHHQIHPPYESPTSATWSMPKCARTASRSATCASIVCAAPAAGLLRRPRPPLIVENDEPMPRYLLPHVVHHHVGMREARAAIDGNHRQGDPAIPKVSYPISTSGV